MTELRRIVIANIVAIGDILFETPDPIGVMEPVRAYKACSIGIRINKQTGEVVERLVQPHGGNADGLLHDPVIFLPSAIILACKAHKDFEEMHRAAWSDIITTNKMPPLPPDQRGGPRGVV